MSATSIRLQGLNDCLNQFYNLVRKLKPTLTNLALSTSPNCELGTEITSDIQYTLGEIYKNYCACESGYFHQFLPSSSIFHNSPSSLPSTFPLSFFLFITFLGFSLRLRPVLPPMDTSPSPSPSPAGRPIINHVGVPFDDDDDRTSEEDVCSICLDSFDSQDNPPTVTNCKHEFHLQCILEWSQRSKECPICWQVIVLKDPSSQELLSAVEHERRIRSVLTVRHVRDDPEVNHDVEYADSDFEEHVIRHFEAAARNMQYSRRRNKHRHSEVGPSQIHPPVGRVDVSAGQEMYTSLEDFHSLGYASSQDNVASSSLMPASIDQTSSSAGLPISNVTSQTTENRALDSQSPSGSPGRPIAADLQAFSESVKSKFSAASARYKESISKSTQGLKAKLLANDSPVKELSRGVQREMSAGIAGVTRIFGRLDPTLKRNNNGINSNFFKGKRVQDSSAETPRDVSLNGETMHL
ncbi:hypothetical protein SSX86_021264 [Deinandra increscens subsp. villosa]|uniref:RING-type E3 ubiquitin transferase n=1 Tax=Deinandra increscens subsp. villosa TaxID=3103831 RepID=A0AAP0CUB7_9ASTR